MTYGNLNTAGFDAWQGNNNQPVPVEALAIALAMPSIEPSGTARKRGGMISVGLTSYFHALCYAWVGDVTRTCDLAEFAIMTGQGTPSSKTNNLTGLQAAGLIEFYKVGRNQWQAALTEAGLAHVTSVNRDLGKAAKAFTVKARDKALAAAERAAKQAAKPVKAKKPVEAEAEVSPAEHGWYGLTDAPQPVEAPAETVVTE